MKSLNLISFTFIFDPASLLHAGGLNYNGYTRFVKAKLNSCEVKMFNQGKPSANFPQHYDAHIGITIPYYSLFHLETINVVKAWGEPGLWLDTGCGTGTLVNKAAQAFPGTAFILADPSPEMLDVARSKLAGKGERIKLLEPAATQHIVLGPAESPDVLTAVLCHHYLSGQARLEATQNCYSLLKKGGMYVTFENIRPLTPAGTEIGKVNWENFQVANGKTVTEAEEHIRRFGVEYFPITVEEHLALLRGCGFKVVELLWYSYMQAGFYCIK
jgi:tRNA (cmo5U34)-methyltransferase